MEPESLRIGNFVIPKQGNFILNKMTFINNNYPQLTRQGMIDLINNHIEVDEVPLTEHWLEKLGFKLICQNNISKTYANDTFEVSFPINDIQDMQIKVATKLIANINGITSVDQIQNLYFDIFGYELEAKLF